MEQITRRSFMRSAALGGAGMAAAGLWTASARADDASPATENAPQASTRISDTVYSTASWRVRPEAVSDFAAEYDADACVCGHGYAGIRATRELANQGYKVVLLEKKPEDTYMAMGNASGTLGGTYIEERGYEAADPVEFFQNWMVATGNVANQALIMKFAQNCRDNIDWYYGLASTEELDTMADYYLDSQTVGGHRLKELGGLKFWNPAYSMYGSCSQTVMQGKQRADAEEHGAEVLFGVEAWDTVQNDDGSIAAVVGLQEDGTFIKVNCKACILSTGGFASNSEMMNDLMLDMVGTLVKGESLSGMMDGDGRGVQMGYWAGGHLENWAIPGMNFKHYSPSTSVQSTQPQALWLDRDGKRFCNGYYPIIEHRVVGATLFKPRDATRCSTTTSTSTPPTTCPSTAALTPPRRTSPRCAATWTRPTPCSRARPWRRRRSPRWAPAALPCRP